jgi:transcriptional regulator with XRE-family HTH domain
VSVIGGDSAYDATREMIRDELRKARSAKGWSQAQLGEAIGTNRFTVIRLESGDMELRPEMAERIEHALGSTGLLALVARRQQLAESDELRSNRDAAVHRLMTTPRLQRVRIILVDDLDVYRLIENNPAVADARIEVVVPTAKRERQLFHGQPIYGHLERQIRKLAELAELVESLGSAGVGTIEVFESPAVLFPLVLARSPAGTECAYWPVVSTEPLIDGREMQAVSTPDPQVTTKMEAHFLAVREQASKIRKNEAVVVVDPEPRPLGEDRPITFTRFFDSTSRGELWGADEALAVSLVLMHTLGPRRDLGIKRRVLVWRRYDEPEVWSLPGHAVEEIDVRRARSIADGADFEDLERTSSDPLAAALVHAPYLVEDSGGVIPIEVFKEAASRWLFATFGIEVAVERLRNVVLPSDLQRIDKDGGDPDRPWLVPRIAPRLFTLDLKTVAADPSSHELGEVKRRADVEEWGYEDLAERGDLNDFLRQTKHTGFLLDLCRRLNVAAR